MICLELESASHKPELVLSAPQETGPRFTGKPTSRTEDSSLILNPRVWVILRNSQLVLLKYSNAGILLSHNCIKEITPLLIAHLTTPGVMPIPNHHSVENQSHLSLILILKLKLFNALMFQTEKPPLPINTISNHTPPLCNQTDASIFTPNLMKIPLSTGFSPQEKTTDNSLPLLNTKSLMTLINIGTGILLMDPSTTKPTQIWSLMPQMDSTDSSSLSQTAMPVNNTSTIWETTEWSQVADSNSPSTMMTGP